MLIGNGQTEVRLNTTTAVGSITLAAVQNFATGLAAADLALADISGDGKSDLLLANNGGNTAVTLINSPDTALTLDRPEATGTILNDDNAVVQFASTADLTVAESAGAQTLTLTLAPASTQPVTVNYSLSGTATSVRDYTVPASVVFAPGETTKALILTVVDDTREDAAARETAIITLTGATNAGLGSNLTRTVTITDNDSAPTVQFSAAGATITEGSSGTVRFAPGETTQTIEIPIIGDLDDEPDETFTVNLSNPVNASLLLASGTGTIRDNDVPPTVQFETAATSLGEASTTVNLTVLLSNAISDAVTVNYVLGAGTAGPQDSSVAAGTVVIPAGQRRGSIAVPLLDDALDEDDETLILQLNSASGAVIGGVSEHTITIVDNDAPPTLQFLNSEDTISEGGQTLITLQLSAPSAKTITARLNTQGTATPGSDYTLGTQQFSFPPGETTLSTPMSALTDTLSEADETAVLVFGTRSNVTIQGITQQTVTIVDTNVSQVMSEDSEGNAVKVTSERGTLSRVQRVETPATAPADARYPHGFFAIDLINLTPGETVDVILTLPAAARPAFYVKCILDVCSRYAGAAITDNVVTLTLTDGGAGDSDGVVNGRISDPGAPAVAKSSGGGTTVTGGGGGGAVNPLLLLVLLILTGVRFASVRRRMNA